MGGGTYTSDVHGSPVALGLVETRLPMAKRGQGKANNEAAERVARQAAGSISSAIAAVQVDEL